MAQATRRRQAQTAEHAEHTETARSAAEIRAGQEQLEARWESFLSDDERTELARYNAEERAELERYTPFARTLELWLKSRSARGWPHVRLAREMGISESTVNSWFNRGILPDPRGVHKLRGILGWPDEKLLALTGYPAMPPYLPEEFDYIREHIGDWPTFDGRDRSEVLEFLDAMHEQYSRAFDQARGQLRPNRRKKPRQAGLQSGPNQ